MLAKLERFFHIFHQFTGNKKGRLCRWKFSVFIMFPIIGEKFEITFPPWLMMLYDLLAVNYSLISTLQI